MYSTYLIVYSANNDSFVSSFPILIYFLGERKFLLLFWGFFVLFFWGLKSRGSSYLCFLVHGEWWIIIIDSCKAPLLHYLFIPHFWYSHCPPHTPGTIASACLIYMFSFVCILEDVIVWWEYTFSLHKYVVLYRSLGFFLFMLNVVWRLNP